MKSFIKCWCLHLRDSTYVKKSPSSAADILSERSGLDFRGRWNCVRIRKSVTFYNFSLKKLD